MKWNGKQAKNIYSNRDCVHKNYAVKSRSKGFISKEEYYIMINVFFDIKSNRKTTISKLNKADFQLKRNIKYQFRVNLIYLLYECNFSHIYYI